MGTLWGKGCCAKMGPIKGEKPSLRLLARHVAHMVERLSLKSEELLDIYNTITITIRDITIENTNCNHTEKVSKISNQN